ncbi:MAG: hypothetical protein H7249_11590 [Chitinophagaceae bacterium]|nr:hypothetical protein [Oligoflexus sp.]
MNKQIIVGITLASVSVVSCVKASSLGPRPKISTASAAQPTSPVRQGEGGANSIVPNTPAVTPSPSTDVSSPSVVITPVVAPISKPLTYTTCTAFTDKSLPNMSYQKSVVFLADGKAQTVERFRGGPDCKNELSDAQVDILIATNGDTTGTTPAKTVDISKMSAADKAAEKISWTAGVTYSGTYTAPDATSLIGTLDLALDTDLVFESYQKSADGLTVLLSYNCNKSEVGHVAICKAVTGDSKATRSTEFSVSDTYTLVP